MFKDLKSNDLPNPNIRMRIWLDNDFLDLDLARPQSENSILI